MATVEPYGTKDGRRYVVRYRVDGKQTMRRGFTTKRDANAFLATTEVAKMRGEYVAPIDGKITIASLGPDWLQRKHGVLKPSAYRVLETAWRVHVEPRWGRVQLGQVRTTDVQAWISGISTGRSATVVIRAVGVLAGVLDDAVKDRRLNGNPARGVRLPAKVRKPRTYLDHGQVWAFADAAGDRRALVLLLAYCGLRWSEAAALRVSDLDLLRRRLTVNRGAVRAGGQIHVGTPKSGKSRTVPIPAIVADEVGHQCEGKGRDDLVFPSPSDGGYVRQGNVRRGWFERARVKAGLPRLTPHDLRHTAASLAVSSGANVKAVQTMLGHASAAMTLDTYADLFAADLDDVAVRLDVAARAVRAQNVLTTGLASLLNRR